MTELEKLRAGLEFDFTDPEVDALKRERSSLKTFPIIRWSAAFPHD